VIAIVGNDAGWTQILRGQVELLGDPVACTLAPTRYDQVAKAWGAEGLYCDNLSQLPNILQEVCVVGYDNNGI